MTGLRWVILKHDKKESLGPLKWIWRLPRALCWPSPGDLVLKSEHQHLFYPCRMTVSNHIKVIKNSCSYNELKHFLLYSCEYVFAAWKACWHVDRKERALGKGLARVLWISRGACTLWVVWCPEGRPMRVLHENRGSKAPKLGVIYYWWNLWIRAGWR